MTQYSSTKLKHKDIIFVASQRLLFIDSGDEITSTTWSGMGASITTLSGVLQAEIDALSASMPVSIYTTITSGTQSKYIEFGTAQTDTNYYAFATTTYSGVGVPIGIGCTTYSGTINGIYVSLTDMVPAEGYGVNLLITR